jgi:hypothetical protein
MRNGMLGNEEEAAGNMTRTNSLLGAALLFLIAFILIRSFIAGIKIYQLNKSAYKKIRKQESFKDWLCYTKYKGLIPKIILILYWVVVISHSLGIVLSIVLWFMENPEEIIRKVLKILFYFDANCKCKLDTCTVEIS